MSKFMYLQVSCSFKLLSVFINLCFPLDPDSSVTELWLKYFMDKSIFKRIYIPFLYISYSK